MNRRDFLKLLGIGAATTAAAPIIFDMGANLWKMREPEIELQTGWIQQGKANVVGFQAVYYDGVPVNWETGIGTIPRKPDELVSSKLQKHINQETRFGKKPGHILLAKADYQAMLDEWAPYLINGA